ncbi:MAG: isoleucine--tRNA ligase [Oscillospiraceae bacterium]|nr:isoleucine--tRNA ligase [Oscillospiraceae bacterium]
MDYKNSIITPKTEFPMRAGLPQREPGMLENWNKIDVYKLLMEKNAGKPSFILHDGPPFSNGDIHMGHALNRALKDFIIRSHAMRGYYTPFTPGWDNHGMPIESAIIKKNKLNHKTMPVTEFRSACEEFAQNFIDRQMAGFRRLGTLGDWERPYKTMNKSFEAEEVKVFGEMYRKGYIYKGLKPVYWCPKDETALAEAEIEYQEDPCTSIYVKFALKDTKGKLETKDTYVIIWTTTPWTLPGNLAIALNPRESYVLVDGKNGEKYIVAEALLEKTMQAGGIDEYEILDRFEGRFFEYMTARHPFLERDSLLVTADYVTMDSGTGCVHTAPGFGADDYQTCRRYNMELIVPVDDRGFQTEDAGKFAGMRYDASNEAILEDLKESGALFASQAFTHSYPHCWRCKNPIIFRATPQWFCSVEAFKEEAAAACDDVQWLPAWGKERMVAMIRDRADWCISRQRRWGLPIPVFYCKDCGKPVCTPETIEHISRLFAEEGSNSWFAREAMALIPEGLSCPHCGGKSFDKETDTLDGWFDSGSTHIASLRLDNPENWPADVYLEGADQYRGWFQSSLLTAVGALGGSAPFKKCLTHGWTVDGEGKAMHKSLGNGVDPAELIRDFGADIVRLWAASADYRADVRCSKEIFKQLSQTYLKFRNTARYCLGNLDGFDANNLVKADQMLELDRWAITKLNELIETAFKAYDNFEFHVLTHAVNDFCVVELSNFYLDIIKDRLYCEAKDGLKRRSAQTALYLIVDAMARLYAPILAYTCDEIWQAMPHKDGDDVRNIVLNDMVKPYTDYALDAESMAKWDALIALRSDVNGVLEAARGEKRIGKALEACVALYLLDEEAKTLWEKVKDMNLPELFIVSDVILGSTPAQEQGLCGKGSNYKGVNIEVLPAAGEKCPRCWMHSIHANAEGLCPRCAAVVAEMDLSE